MRTKIATIVVLVAMLAAAALVGATMAGADQVSGAAPLAVPTTPQGATTAIPSPTAAACANGVDDDGDGLLDTLDPDCESPEDTTEEPATVPPAGETTAPSIPAIPTPPSTSTPAGEGEKKGDPATKEEEKPTKKGGLEQGETIGGGNQAEIRGGVTHNDDLGDASGGGPNGGAGAVKAPSATGGGDQPLDKEDGDGGSQFEAGGSPTLANPTTTIAPFGPAPIGVPNFIIDSFEIPPFLLPIYQACGTEYGIPWEVLASINKIETGFGTNTNVSSAGAVGWMQFLPSSWEMYGLDANGDGRKDPYNPVDAICAAAHYLKVAGGHQDLYQAIFAYNHAEWYVADVLGDAEKWSAIGSIEASASCEVSAPNEAVAKMIAEADRLSAMRPETEYIWGGSHGISPTPRNGPFDCSSAVSHELQVGGFGNETMTTIGFMSWGEPGPGKWVTILNKPYEPEAHVVLRFEPGVTPPEKRYWGTSGFIEPGHGPGWIPESTFDAGYLSRFEERHPPGL